MDRDGPVPVAALGTRVREHGRIRLGVKSGRAMKSIDTFRFTSPDSMAIQAIASEYGGTPKPWSDPKASPKNQFEVITTADEISVWFPPDALSIWYELWSGAGNQRRCDGIICQAPKGKQIVEVPCICAERKRLECKPTTRLQVILPAIRFGGVWRLETKGWNAAHELPGMVAALEQLQSEGLLVGKLRVERRERVYFGEKRSFVVPAIILDASPQGVLDGAAAPTGALGPALAPLPALGTGTDAPWESDDNVAEAEIVEDVTEELVALAHDALAADTVEVDDVKDPVTLAVELVDQLGQAEAERWLTGAATRKANLIFDGAEWRAVRT